MNPPDDSQWEWFSKYAGTLVTALIGAASGVIGALSFAYKYGSSGAAIESRLRAVEAWTQAHDKAVGAILDRLDNNVGRINERIDRLSELIIQVSRKIGD